MNRTGNRTNIQRWLFTILIITRNTAIFNQWNNGYVYGSDNTTQDNFWKKWGTQKTSPYQPSSLLAVDLGEPTHEYLTVLMPFL
ncbi:hypothetical protein O9992_24540 [Vibrio lentus]|nr:hypothetical protein [Vibrio lentus]